MGVRGPALKLITSYLTNRQQYVSSGKLSSDLCNINFGCPQGSVLSPLLFNLFLNDILNLPLTGKIILYADDICVSYINTDTSLLYKNMQQDVLLLDNWFKSNFLTMNIKKTKFMIISPSKSINCDSPPVLDNIKIEQVSEFKYLGLLIDENLKWSEHIDDQLGVALELRGLVSGETENAYRKAIQLDPSFAPAYAHLGRLLRRRGLTKESAAAYQNAVDHSTDVAMMILVADVMQSEQRYAESEKLLYPAIDADPKNPAALLLLGRALTTQGNFTDAEIMLRRSLNVSSNGFMANSLLGDLFMRQGRFEDAENSLLLAIRFVPMSEKRRLSQQFETVGDGYFKSGKRRNAERAYQRAMSLDPESLTLGGKLAKTFGG